MSVDVEQLTRDHKKAISTDDGIEFHSVPSLISQLRDAVFGGMERGAGSTSSGSRMLIDPAALDLYQDIDRDITEAWVAAFNRVPSADRPETLLSEWAAWAQDETIVTVRQRYAYASALVAYWVTRIEDFFDPPRSAEIQAACIACGQDHFLTEVAGESRKSTALRFVRDRATGATVRAECAACGATWTPSQFEYLAEKIGIDVATKKREHEEREAAAQAKENTRITNL